MGWRFYTGITGLLGQYLLCEALRRRESVAVLARGHGGVSASDRVDLLLAKWERRLGRVLPRPIVLEGDLLRRGVGLSKSERNWFHHNIVSVVHAAASVRFQEFQGEPMLSNVQGTRNLLGLCENSSVQDFHYISTAYTCGKVDRTTVVREQAHSQEGPFWNVYEESKCLAEQLVIEGEGTFSKTIHRPSVIVGETTSGYVPSFNALYTLVRYAWLTFRSIPISIRTVEDLLAHLKLPIDGTINLVPVEWVAEAVQSIVTNRDCHGSIYHLTNPRPTTNREIGAAIAAALSIAINADAPPTPIGDHLRAGLSEFGRQMELFNSYAQVDPVFDCSNFASQPNTRTCPNIGVEELTRTLTYAVKSRFATELSIQSDEQCEPRRELDDARSRPRVKTLKGPRRGHGRRRDQASLAKAVSEDPIEADSSSHPRFVLRLVLSGPGGGDWKIAFGSHRIFIDYPTDDSNQSVLIYASAATFRAWRSHRITFEDGLRVGAFVAIGGSPDLSGLSEMMTRFSQHLDRLGNLGPSGGETSRFENQKIETVPETLKC